MDYIGCLLAFLFGIVVENLLQLRRINKKLKAIGEATEKNQEE